MKKKLLRFAALMIALAFVFAGTACRGGDVVVDIGHDTPAPTAKPTTSPTAEPTPEPTAEPTPEPTPEPAPANFDGLAEQPTTVFAEGEQPSYTTTADASMNLRSGPGTNFDKVTSVPAGTAVTALGTNSDGSWVGVQVGGQFGWLKVEFLNQ